jgi:hypothetical protein
VYGHYLLLVTDCLLAFFLLQVLILSLNGHIFCIIIIEKLVFSIESKVCKANIVLPFLFRKRCDLKWQEKNARFVMVQGEKYSQKKPVLIAREWAAQKLYSHHIIVNQTKVNVKLAMVKGHW